MNNTIRDAAIVCAFAFTFGARWISAQTPPGAGKLDRAGVAAWRDDLSYMAREMARRHKHLYHTVTPTRFDSAVADLHRRIPSLERHRIIEPEIPRSGFAPFRFNSTSSRMDYSCGLLIPLMPS
jgi:hypothetical protein